MPDTSLCRASFLFPAVITLPRMPTCRGVHDDSGADCDALHDVAALDDGCHGIPDQAAAGERIR